MTTSASALVYFFCSSDSEAQRNSLAILRSFVWQVATRNETALEWISEQYRGQNSISASQSDLWRILRFIVNHVPNCIFVIDGFDECKLSDEKLRKAGNTREQFLAELKNAVAHTTTRVLLMSRDEVDIRSQMSPDVTNSTKETIYEYNISLNDVRSDIHLFSKSIVDNKLFKKDNTFREELANLMADRCMGMFLWIKLQETDLRGGKGNGQLRRLIQNTPSGLEQAYERDWTNLLKQSSHDRSRALAILRWTLFALRPLTLLEMKEALITMLGDDVGDLQDPIDEEFVKDEILGLCGSFLEIREAVPEQPLDSRTIHLVHFSVKEFLLTTTYNSDLFTRDGSAFSDQVTQNNHLASACLRYLNLKQVWSSYEEDPTSRPFLKYAAESWYQHMSSGSNASVEMTQLINSFFEPGNPNWNAWSRMFEFAHHRETNPGGPLYYASWLGLVGTIRWLKEERNEDPNAIGGHYGNALQAACVKGHMAAVIQLCGDDIDINIRGGRNHRTAFHAAAYFGHQSIVQYLADLGADMTMTDRHGKTPLHSAAYNGHLEVVRFLLDNGADIAMSDSKGVTPLHVAADVGHFETVKLLLDKGADIAVTDSDGQTSLFAAVYSGDFETVKLLLDKGADIAMTDSEGWTPLFAAAHNGHFETVKLLLDKGADIALTDSVGRNSLFAAAQEGHFETVKLLLEKGADIAVTDSDGWTPLFAAAHNGHFETVKFLLDRGADISAVDSNGWTPLHTAAFEGHFEIVKVLLAAGTAHPLNSCLDETSFHATTADAALKTTSLLSDNAGSFSTTNTSHADAVSQWLNRKNFVNQTSLHLTALGRRKYVFDFLLSHRPDVNLHDGYDLTCFDYVRHDDDIIQLMKIKQISYCFTETSVQRSYIVEQVIRILNQVQSQSSFPNLFYHLDHCLLLLRDMEAARHILQEIFACCDNCGSICGSGDWYACSECAELDLCKECMTLYPTSSTRIRGCTQHEFVEIEEKPASDSSTVTQTPDEAEKAKLQWFKELRLKYISISNSDSKTC
jgi:ankyrin repeat protein